MATQKQYIELLDGRSVRVAFNLGVYEALIKTIGQKKFNQLSKGLVDPAAYKVAYLEMIKAGESLDGRETTLTLEDMGRLISFPQMRQFIEVIQAESKSTFKQYGRIISN